MTASVGNFRDLVAKAYGGELKLPAFQREWRWQDEKVLKLYDSLRLRYPIGAFLFLPGKDSFLSPRPFQGSRDLAAATETEQLVLDGQQRLTAGVHLFYATGKKQYFLDIAKIATMISDQGIDMEDVDAVREFCSNIDYDDGYMVAKSASVDPRAFLLSHDLLCTSILTEPTKLNMAVMDYIQAKPQNKDLVLRVIQPYFSLSATEAVPLIIIGGKPSVSAISRIFTTLNTTGKMLTPFELVVAMLYPIKLREEVAKFREESTFYENMDSSGEILLQTIAMLAGVDQKKANLPKSIKPDTYQQNKIAAFDALEELGRFLTQSIGCGLDASGKLVPYDAIYAPMALALRYVTAKGVSGPDEAAAKNKLRLWFVSAALSQRYQEGVHNKQVGDYKDVVQWIDDDNLKPAWISQTRVPFLTGVSFDGAIGRMVQCFINSRDPRDPVVTGKPVGYRAGADITEKHHVFPTKYVDNIVGWDKKTDKSNQLLNMMYVERSTNKRWLNANPRDHIFEAMKNVSLAALEGVYDKQFISSEAVQILSKPEKSRQDYHRFLELRQASIRTWIKDEFGVSSVDHTVETEDEMEGDGGATG